MRACAARVDDWDLVGNPQRCLLSRDKGHAALIPHTGRLIRYTMTSEHQDELRGGTRQGRHVKRSFPVRISDTRVYTFT